MRKILAGLVLSVALSGCAGVRAQAAMDGWREKLDPLAGQSSEAVMETLGPPLTVQTYGRGREVWVYSDDYGTRSSGFANAYGTRQNAWAYASGSSYAVFDRINVYFANDRMVNWNGYVQR